MRKNYTTITERLLQTDHVQQVYNYQGELALYDAVVNQKMDAIKLFKLQDAHPGRPRTGTLRADAHARTCWLRHQLSTDHVTTEQQSRDVCTTFPVRRTRDADIEADESAIDPTASWLWCSPDVCRIASTAHTRRLHPPHKHSMRRGCLPGF